MFREPSDFVGKRGLVPFSTVRLRVGSACAEGGRARLKGLIVGTGRGEEGGARMKGELRGS